MAVLVFVIIGMDSSNAAGVLKITRMYFTLYANEEFNKMSRQYHHVIVFELQ